MLADELASSTGSATPVGHVTLNLQVVAVCREPLLHNLKKNWRVTSLIEYELAGQNIKSQFYSSLQMLHTFIYFPAQLQYITVIIVGMNIFNNWHHSF